MSILDAVDAIHGKRNSYGTTLFGDGARFDRGGGRQVRGPVTRWNLMATRRSDETFLSLQALSSSHFARRKRPFSTKCVWNQQAKARFGFDAHENEGIFSALFSSNERRGDAIVRYCRYNSKSVARRPPVLFCPPYRGAWSAQLRSFAGRNMVHPPRRQASLVWTLP